MFERVNINVQDIWGCIVFYIPESEMIAGIRCIKILTWLRGFRVKIANFSLLRKGIVLQFPEETWTQRTPNAVRVFSRDVTAAILVSQNNETAAMLVSQTSQ